MGERNKKILLEQLQLLKNKHCADCGTKDPEWASSNVGVFICVHCSGIHRMLGTHISRVKSCRLDQWDDESVAFMCERGNDVVNAELERHLPPYYHKAVSTDPQVFKEQFIQAKYSRKEFTQAGGPAHYEKGAKTGNLHKRGKDDKTYRIRKFVLNATDGTLKYFIKPDVLKRMARFQQKQGWMSKTGPKDAYPKGSIYLGSRVEGYIVRDGLPAGQQETGYGITVTTPERDFLFLCENQEDQRSWITEIKGVLSRPLTEQDTKDLLSHKHLNEKRRRSVGRLTSSSSLFSLSPKHQNSEHQQF